MRLDNEASVPSPALLVDPDRVEENLRRMVRTVGSVDRLRPHVKTHKLPQLVALQVELGITRCKCATISEAEMAVRAGASDILLAAQPVGPNIGRFVALTRAFPEARFSTILDDIDIARALGEAALAAELTLDVFIDIDVGQHRTGIGTGPAALEFCRAILGIGGLRFSGLHAYDGHLRQRDPGERTRAVEEAWRGVFRLRDDLALLTGRGPALIGGGTPTFPIHARNPDIECSPGTCTLWDAGYADGFPDLDFLHAAALLTRVISRPIPDRICLDLGHKAVASEMPHPRVVFPALPDAIPVVHSEEHLVLETSRAAEFPVGSVLYGIPWHICPTVALHGTVHVVKDGRAVAEWPVTARQRRLEY
jgi:D-threonine aldolase